MPSRPSPEKRDYRQLGIWQIPHDDNATSQDLALQLRKARQYDTYCANCLYVSIRLIIRWYILN
jgi:hypothetical protein